MKTAYEYARSFVGLDESNCGDWIKTFHKSANIIADGDSGWCSSFMAYCQGKAGVYGPFLPTARSWLNFGIPVGKRYTQEGDVVVFYRESKESWKGHVGFFVGYDFNGDVLVLGGNQDNAVSYKSYPKDRLLGFVRI